MCFVRYIREPAYALCEFMVRVIKHQENPLYLCKIDLVEQAAETFIARLLSF
jgi:hypothetical protein